MGRRDLLLTSGEGTSPAITGDLVLMKIGSGKFALDSSLEGTGFEPSVPLKKNLLVETVVFSTFPELPFREGLGRCTASANLALGLGQDFFRGRIPGACAGGPPEENSAALDQA
jgi:hypothetical protein